MYNTVICTVVLSFMLYTVYGLNGEELCRKIVAKKFIKYFKQGKRAYKNYRTKPFEVCSPAFAVSNYVFPNPELLMCAEYFASYIARADQVKIWSYVKDNCRKNRKLTDLIPCKMRGGFQTCVNKKMPYTLRGLANNEDRGKFACEKCYEIPFLVKCAKSQMLHKKCPYVFKAMDVKTFPTISCSVCEQEKRKATQRPTKITLKPDVTKTKYMDKTTTPSKGSRETSLKKIAVTSITKKTKSGKKTSRNKLPVTPIINQTKDGQKTNRSKLPVTPIINETTGGQKTNRNKPPVTPLINKTKGGRKTSRHELTVTPIINETQGTQKTSTQPSYIKSKSYETKGEIKQNKIRIVMIAAAGLCASVIVFIGISYYVNILNKMNRELEDIKASKSSRHKDITFKYLKTGHIPKPITDDASTSYSREVINTRRNQRKRKKPRRK